MARPRKASSSQSADLALGQRELRSLPARLLTKLPIETRIYVQAIGTKSEFILTTALDAPSDPARGERRRPCWLAASEVDALVLGVEVDRTFASDLTAFALRKLHDRGFRVTAEHALAGALLPDDDDCDPAAPYQRRELSVGQVLDALDLELVGIELGPVDQRDSGAPPARAA